MLDALEHDLAQSLVPTVPTSVEVRIAHRNCESTRDTATVVDMTVDDSDHEVAGPLVCLLSDNHSGEGEHLNEQAGPDHGGAGRRKRLVLGYWKHGEDSLHSFCRSLISTVMNQMRKWMSSNPQLSPPTDMERRGSTWKSFCKFR